MPKHTYVGSRVYHNYLGDPEAITLIGNTPGIKHFETKEVIHIAEGDILLLWSKKGTNKTLWQVVSVSKPPPSLEGIGGTKNKYTGVVRDLYYYGQVTTDIKAAVRMTDDVFIVKEEV